MWIEAIFSKDDFVRIVAQLLPMEIALGDEGNHLSLHDPSELTLVPNQGVRLGCKASVRWSVIGIAVPIVINAVTVLLHPEIVKREGGRDRLVFSIVIENADLAGIPAFLDEKIRDKVNEVLKTKRSAFSWDFSDTLTRTVDLPDSLRPLESLSLEVAWGKVKVTDEALVLAISFHSAVTRHGVVVDSQPRAHAAVTAPLTSADNHVLARRDAPRGAALVDRGEASPIMLGGAALALAIGGAYGVMRVTGDGPRRRFASPRSTSLFSTIVGIAATTAVVAIGSQVATNLARTLLARTLPVRALQPNARD